MLRKLSTKTILAEVEAKDWAKFKDGEKRRLLYSIGGTATGVKSGESSNGPFIGFTGEFVALVNPAIDNRKEKDREPISGYTCYLPKPMEEMLKGSLSMAEKGVEFAVEVFIRPPNDDESVKYVYEIEPVIKVQESSAAARMLANMKARMTGKPLPPETAPAETGKKK